MFVIWCGLLRPAGQDAKKERLTASGQPFAIFLSGFYIAWMNPFIATVVNPRNMIVAKM